MASKTRIRIGLLFALGVATVLFASVYLFVLPKIYRAQALIHVSGATPATRRSTSLSDFEMLHSKTVLTQVISNLNLNERWTQQRRQDPPFTTDQSYFMLRALLDIQVRRAADPALISVACHSSDPAEPAMIANEVAAVYREFCLGTVQIVRLIDKAMPATTPVRPNPILGSAVLVLGAGLIVAALLWLAQAPSNY